MTALNSLIGVILAFLIGSACRYFKIPLPAPPKLSGAFLVFTMTCGFVVTGLLLS